MSKWISWVVALAPWILVACVTTDDVDTASTTQPLTALSQSSMPLVFESPSGCLDASTTDLYGFLVPAACNGSTSQKWRSHPTGELQSASSGSCIVWGPKVIGRKGGAIRTGTFLDACSVGQPWVPTPTGELRSGGSCLSATAGSIVVAAACDRSAAQHWKPRLAPPTSSLEDQYGFGAMRRQWKHTSQAVPLMRVYMNYRLMNSGVLAHSLAYYEDRILGSRGFAVNAYLADVSSGQFRYEDAGHFGPFDDETHHGGCDTGVVLEEVLATFMDHSIDLAAFDTNRDGTVDHHELQFMVIGNCGGRTAGANRHVGCLDNLDSGPGHLRACPGDRVAEIEDLVEFDTLAHESLHPVGAEDLYPDPFSVPEGLSVMGATINQISAPDSNTSLMLDAWHRFRLGWNHPIIESLAANQLSHGTVSLTGDRNWHSSLIVGTAGSYHLFEPRDLAGYDANGGFAGILVWSFDAALTRPTSTRPSYRDYDGNNWVSSRGVTPAQGQIGYNSTSGGVHGVVLTDGRTLAVWATGTAGNYSLSWVVGGTLDITVIEHGEHNTSTTANITIEARDHETGMRFPGKVTVEGQVVGNTDLPVDYNRRLDLSCNQFGQCTVVYRPLQFAVTAPGHDTATFMRP